VSASLNSLATSSVVDIYRRIIKLDGSDLHYTFASRWATVLWGLLATEGAFYADRLGALNLAFSKAQSLLGGVILGIFLLGICSKRVTGTGVIVGSVAGSAAAFYSSGYTFLSMYWYCVIGCIVTCFVAWLYSKILQSGA
jgi:Na+/proline symporter